MTEDRGTGRTTRQMTEASPGAWYVWCNNTLAYPRDLAAHLGRRDLRIISPDQVDERIKGSQHHVVLDHATRLNERQWETVMAAWERAR